MNVLSLLDETLHGVTFYHAVKFPRQLYENTGIDTSQMPPGTYIGAVKGHGLSGNVLLILHGSPRREDTFVYTGNEVWNRLTAQPITHDSIKILTDKVLGFDPRLRQVPMTFVNRERAMQLYSLGRGDDTIHVYVEIKGVTHSGFSPSLWALLHHAHRFIISRLQTGQRVSHYNYGHTPYTAADYNGSRMDTNSQYRYSTPSMHF